eukprot:jgi/Chrzof1/1297/Cz10g02040.t1
MIQVAFTLPIMLDDFKSADNLFFNALSGELSYELEAAELVQSELRAAHAAAEALKKEQAALQDKLEDTEYQLQRCKADAAEVAASLDSSRQSQQQSAEECVMLRRALEQTMHKLQLFSGGESSMIDKSVISKVLVTYFERNHSKEVLTLLASMLNMSDEDKARIGAGTAGKRGLLRSVVGAPFAIVRAAGSALVGGGPAGGGGGRGDVKDTIADQWVDFLLATVNKEEGAGAGGSSAAGVGAGSAGAGAGAGGAGGAGGATGATAAAAGVGAGAQWDVQRDATGAVSVAGPLTVPHNSQLAAVGGSNVPLSLMAGSDADASSSAGAYGSQLSGSASGDPTSAVGSHASKYNMPAGTTHTASNLELYTNALSPSWRHNTGTLSATPIVNVSSSKYGLLDKEQAGYTSGSGSSSSMAGYDRHSMPASYIPPALSSSSSAAAAPPAAAVSSYGLGYSLHGAASLPRTNAAYSQHSQQSRTGVSMLYYHGTQGNSAQSLYGAASTQRTDTAAASTEQAPATSSTMGYASLGTNAYSLYGGVGMDPQLRMTDKVSSSQPHAALSAYGGYSAVPPSYNSSTVDAYQTTGNTN